MARTPKNVRNGLSDGANGALHMASDYADSANQALHAGFDRAQDQFNDVSKYAVKRGRKMANQAQGYAADVVPLTARFVRNNPMLSVGLAIGVGLFLGLSARR